MLFDWYVLHTLQYHIFILNIDITSHKKNQLMLKYQNKQMDETTAELIMDVDKLMRRWNISWGCGKNIIEIISM